MLHGLGLQPYQKETLLWVVFRNFNPTCRNNSMENTFCQWFGDTKTVSVVNIDSKMMLQMFETSFCVSGAALVCCSGQMVLWKI